MVRGAGPLIAAIALVSLSAISTVTPALAQVRPQVAPGFLIDRHAPAVAGSEWFGAESLDFRGNVRPALRAVLSSNRDPFVITAPDGDGQQAVVARQTFLHLGLSLNLWDHVRFAVDVP
ncbi:MAG TPA: hypothetical protein VGF45_23015, partial [Polyangia bacterium]